MLPHTSTVDVKVAIPHKRMSTYVHTVTTNNVYARLKLMPPKVYIGGKVFK